MRKMRTTLHHQLRAVLWMSTGNSWKNATCEQDSGYGYPPRKSSSSEQMVHAESSTHRRYSRDDLNLCYRANSIRKKTSTYQRLYFIARRHHAVSNLLTSN
ncbi:hypothetical protein GOP47_0008937 [Adiantum capillus-veneris]|uniref:Uncharacterized protein n=1 Tax=Adiantum capillus-veneris TaxID=13818 RepID=A0A9D4V0R8_ADICA|nr:hypothetical protein GOP47_0008937 [Adiantum capillus-veneris]